MSARDKATPLLPVALEPLAHHKWAPDDLAVVTGVVTTFVDLLNSAIDRAEKAEQERDAIRDERETTVTDHDDLRAAWAHVVRDHDMPPNKDQRGYDYRMGWWDAVIHLDRILTRGLRSCEDCPRGGDDQ